MSVGPVRFPVTRSRDGLWQAKLVALAPGSTYRLHIAAGGASVDRAVMTAAIPANTFATTENGRFMLDGKPFFPIMAWGQCRDGYTPLIALGIDVFVGGCPWYGPELLLPELAGRAYIVLPFADSHSGIEAPGLIGWNYPDEADGFGALPKDLSDLPPAADTGRIRFFTVTNHFYSVSDPVSPALPKSLYPAYYAKADAVGFDLYPVAKYCYSEFIGVRDVFSAEQELVVGAAPRPTYEWIETGPLEGECTAARLSPQLMRAEAWLAIAGGAAGIGWFTHTWDANDTSPLGGWKRYEVGPEIAAEIIRTNAQLKELAPALTAPTLKTSADAPLACGGRLFAGVRYVVAVNPSAAPVTGTIAVTGLRTQRVNALWEGRTVVASDGTIADTWAPYEVHVYTAVPPRR